MSVDTTDDEQYDSGRELVDGRSSLTPEKQHTRQYVMQTTRIAINILSPRFTSPRSTSAFHHVAYTALADDSGNVHVDKRHSPTSSTCSYVMLCMLVSLFFVAGLLLISLWSFSELSNSAASSVFHSPSAAFRFPRFWATTSTDAQPSYVPAPSPFAISMWGHLPSTQSDSQSNTVSASDALLSFAAPVGPINIPADPEHILASDGHYYRLSDYKDGFLWPHRTANNTPNATAMAHHKTSDVYPLPRLLPYPPNRTPPKPRVDFVLRAFAGYATLTQYMLRSMELFVPRGLGDIIVVLDDNRADHHYATTLPDYVRVYYENPPAHLSEWKSDAQGASIGTNRARFGYQLGLYSNWISDRYSDADYICVLDPDLLFTTPASLTTMFDWDEQQQLYKPIWICKDAPEDEFKTSSYALFPDELWPDKRPNIGCMNQLPVCLHRSTLKTVRQHLNHKFAQKHADDYKRLGYDPTVDRDSNYTAFMQQWRARQQQNRTNSTSTALAVPATAFERTYMHMVNIAPAHAVCQFCVWGSYIYLNAEERKRYSFHRQGQHSKNGGCPWIRAAMHMGYATPQSPKASPAYYSKSDGLLADGVCRGSLPTDCNYQWCVASNYTYNSSSLDVTPAQKFPGSSAVLRQIYLYAFEWHDGRDRWDMGLQNEHAARCEAVTMQQTHQHYQWIHDHNLVPRVFREKQCGSLVTTRRDAAVASG